MGLGLAFAALAALAWWHNSSIRPILLRTTVVGQNPTLIAVDARTERAFVLDDGSMVKDATGIMAGAIHVLDTRTGALLYTTSAGATPQDVIVDEPTQRVFVLNSYMHQGGQGTVTVLDAQSGQVLHTTLVGNLPEAEALDQRAGHVFVLNKNNDVPSQTYTVVSVLDGVSGRRVGVIKVGPIIDRGPDRHAFTFEASQERAIAAVDGPRGPVLDVLDTWRGRLVRTISVGPDSGDLLSAPGRVFVLGSRTVRMYDTMSGRLLHSIRVSYYLNGSANDAVVDEHTHRIFLASPVWDARPNAPNWGRTNAGWLSILDARSGVLLRTGNIAWPGGMAVDERTGHILITYPGPLRPDGTVAGPGHVDVLDGDRGTVLATIPVGVAPGAIAIDARSGHALVVNAGGRLHVVADSWGWLPLWLRQRLPFIPPIRPATTRVVPSSISLLALPR